MSCLLLDLNPVEASQFTHSHAITVFDLCRYMLFPKHKIYAFWSRHYTDSLHIEGILPSYGRHRNTYAEDMVILLKEHHTVAYRLQLKQNTGEFGFLRRMRRMMSAFNIVY